MDRDEIDDLDAEWSLVATPPVSIATSAAGVVFAGFGDGTAIALDQISGCTHWQFNGGPGAVTAIGVTDWTGDHFGVQRPLAYFAQANGVVRVLDMLSGQPLWDRQIDGTVMGAPVLLDDTMFVPAMPSAPEDHHPDADVSVPVPLVALSIQDGAVRWRTELDEDGERGGSRKSPVIDTQRRLLIFATDGNRGAVVAASLDSGEVIWAFEPQNPAAFHAGLIVATTLEGSQQVIAVDRRGVVYALRPDNGELVWRRDAGHGNALLGVESAMTADNERVYVPITAAAPSDSAAGPSRMVALDLLTGQESWSTPIANLCQQRAPCAAGVDSAIFLVDGVIAAGHLDGRLIAYSATDGTIMDAADYASRSLVTLDGSEVHLAQFTGGGITIGNGRLWATGLTADERGILLALRAQ